MDIKRNLELYKASGMGSYDREASFSYCFNYFQGFRDAKNTAEIANANNLQTSCLQLGFFLASWGMYRGSADLLKRSSRVLITLIETIAVTEPEVWEIDVDRYSEGNIDRICAFSQLIWKQYPKMTDTLLTKILLGVFGNVPAFDTNFKGASNALGLPQTFGKKALIQIGNFYTEHSHEFESFIVPTLEFLTGSESETRRYSKAKLLDMAFFVEGEILQSKKIADI
jgi:hypothetical protein